MYKKKDGASSGGLYLLSPIQHQAHGSECADFNFEAAVPDRDGLADGAAAQIHRLHLFDVRSLGQSDSDCAGLAGLFPKAQDRAEAVGIGAVGSDRNPFARKRQSAQQSLEACLLEMVITSQCLDDPFVTHDDEGDAIGQGPLLVGPGAVN